MNAGSTPLASLAMSCHQQAKIRDKACSAVIPIRPIELTDVLYERPYHGNGAVIRANLNLQNAIAAAFMLMAGPAMMESFRK